MDLNTESPTVTKMLNFTKDKDLMMATCKELNVEVDEACEVDDVTVASTTMSLECVLEGGHDSAGSDSDSSMDSDTPSLGIDVILHYKLKVQKKSEKFKKLLHIPLPMEKFLKWLFIMNNSNSLQQKILGLRHIAENVKNTNRTLEIFLGKQKQGESFDKLRQEIEKIIFRNSDSIVISWFPLNASYDGEEVYKVLNRMLQQSGLSEDIYTELVRDKHLIRFVHDVKDKDKAVEITSKAIKKFEQEARSNYQTKTIKLLVVYRQIFKRCRMKKEAEKLFPNVHILFDMLESRDEFVVHLQGPRTDVDQLYNWMQDKLVNPYYCKELSFNEVEMFEEPIDVGCVIEETLGRENYTDLYWEINRFSRKVWISSFTKSDTDKAVDVAKKCVKKTSKNIKDLGKQADETEAMAKELSDATNGLVGKCVAVRVIADNNELVIDISGQDRHVQKLDTWVDSYIQKRSPLDTSYAVSEHTSSIQETEQEPHLGNQGDDNTTSSVQSSNHGINQGEPSNCVKVKEKLTQLTDDHKTGMAVIEQRHWDIQNGNRLTVRLSLEGLDDVDITISADTVHPDEAKFDKSGLLHLPKWIDGMRQEKEITRNCVKDFLTFCSDENLYKIKIKVVHLDKRIARQFIFGISLSNDIKRVPLQLYLCTDNTDMYGQLVDFCVKTIQTTEPSCHPPVRRPPVHPPPESHPPESQERPRDRLQITIIRGTLNDTKADVIVNTTGKDLNLDVGNVSKALLKSAGPQLQQEVKKKCPYGVKYGEIVVTHGYNLQGCQYVLHGALDTYRSVGNVGSLQQFVSDCLVEADYLCCHTIAFPAIGTGNLGYPKHAVAKAMFDAVRQFDGRQKHLTEVMFVIYHQDKDIIAEFEKQDGQQTTTISREHREEMVYIGKIGVTFKYGTAEDIKNSGIIYIWERNSTYNVRTLDHDLLKHAGPDVQKSWTAHRDNKEMRDKPLITPGGQLPVDCIIHVFCIDSSYHLREALISGLKKAENLETVTVLFNGASKFLRYDSALTDALIQSVQNIQNQRTKLQTVCMMIDQKQVAKRFLAYLLQNIPTEELSGRSQESFGRSQGQETSNKGRNPKMMTEPKSSSMDREGM